MAERNPASNAPYFLRKPLDFSEARQAARDIAQGRQDVVKELEIAVEALAEAEVAYHRTKATAMVMLSGAGVGVTEAQERIKGEPDVADRLRKREDAKNKVMILEERLESIDGERASFHRLVEWSQRLGMNE